MSICMLLLFAGQDPSAEHREGHHHEHAEPRVAEREQECRRRLHLQGRQLGRCRREQPHPAEDHV